MIGKSPPPTLWHLPGPMNSTFYIVRCLLTTPDPVFTALYDLENTERPFTILNAALLMISSGFSHDKANKIPDGDEEMKETSSSEGGVVIGCQEDPSQHKES
jgi:hypothetical protein